VLLVLSLLSSVIYSLFQTWIHWMSYMLSIIPSHVFIQTIYKVFHCRHIPASLLYTHRRWFSMTRYCVRTRLTLFLDLLSACWGGVPSLRHCCSGWWLVVCCSCLTFLFLPLPLKSISFRLGKTASNLLLLFLLFEMCLLSSLCLPHNIIMKKRRIWAYWAAITSMFLSSYFLCNIFIEFTG
jgi:hypothetical protein